MSYEDQRSGAEQGRRGRGAVNGSLVLAALAVAALVAFVVQNTERVNVDWLFFSGRWALWLVVVITVVLTLVAERLVTFALRRRRHH